MSLIFSRQCEYALQAVLYLALKPEGVATPLKEMTGKLKIPYHFLGKILQRLAYKGILTSKKGPHGGFALGVPAKGITLFHVVEAIDGVGFMQNCVLGFPGCGTKNPCSVHDRWEVLRDGIYAMLVSRNIAQLANETKKSEYKVGAR